MGRAWVTSHVGYGSQHPLAQRSLTHTLVLLHITQASAYLAKYTNFDELLLGIAITVAALAVFGPLCGVFGGALFNPVNSIALVCSGKGSLPSHIIRMVGVARPFTLSSGPQKDCRALSPTMC